MFVGWLEWLSEVEFELIWDVLFGVDGMSEIYVYVMIGCYSMCNCYLVWDFGIVVEFGWMVIFGMWGLVEKDW